MISLQKKPLKSGGSQSAGSAVLQKWFDCRSWAAGKSLDYPQRCYEAQHRQAKKYAVHPLYVFDDRPFQPEKAVAAIEVINGSDERNIAREEYYYFSGQTEKTEEIALYRRICVIGCLQEIFTDRGFYVPDGAYSKKLCFDYFPKAWNHRAKRIGTVHVDVKMSSPVMTQGWTNCFIYGWSQIAGSSI